MGIVFNLENYIRMLAAHGMTLERVNSMDSPFTFMRLWMSYEGRLLSSIRQTNWSDPGAVMIDEMVAEIRKEQADIDAEMMPAKTKSWEDPIGECDGRITIGFDPKKMDFGYALDVLRQGCRVARAGWNGKGMFLFLVPGSRITVSAGRPLAAHLEVGTEVDYLPHIDMKTAQGGVVPWLASQTDLLAEDWSVVG